MQYVITESITYNAHIVFSLTESRALNATNVAY